jgi:hypothetical protein
LGNPYDELGYEYVFFWIFEFLNFFLRPIYISSATVGLIDLKDHCSSHSVIYSMVKWTFMMRVIASNQFMTAREARRQEARQMEKERRQFVAKEMKNFRPRKYEGKSNYLTSTWGRLLFNARIRDPTDKKGGKLFRRRFRVPYPLFEHLVEMTRNSGWFSEAADCTGQMAAPLELKILAV